MKAYLLSAAVLALPGLALAEDVITQTYVCDRGAMVQATYINIAERSLAVLSVEGRHLAFDIATAASGARSVAMDAAPPPVWWTKGDTAMLLWHDGATSAEVTLYAACRLKE